MDNAINSNQSPRRLDQVFDHWHEHNPVLGGKDTPRIHTHIYLPDQGGNICNCDMALDDCKLHLPSYTPLSIDRHLKGIPQLLNSAQKLFASPVRHYSRHSKERLLYVGQGEVGHATPKQCDVMASDRATTCHILALRSTSFGRSLVEPLGSVAHVDWCGYTNCIQNMIEQHKYHHLSSICTSMDQDGGFELPENAECNRMIKIDVHVMGGFDDPKQSSCELSDFLMDTLIQLAEDERHLIQFTLRTCAISSMNDTGCNEPIGRGLGINVETGDVFLTKVDRPITGPFPELRSARLWAGSNGEMLVIHQAPCGGDSSDDYIVIEPFHFRPRKRFVKLLHLSNRDLLLKTSTSPNMEEEEDFCSHVRQTFRFMLHERCSKVFGPDCDKPVFFHRKGNTNQWELVTDPNKNVKKKVQSHRL